MASRFSRQCVLHLLACEIIFSPISAQFFFFCRLFDLQESVFKCLHSLLPRKLYTVGAVCTALEEYILSLSLMGRLFTEAKTTAVLERYGGTEA